MLLMIVNKCISFVTQSLQSLQKCRAIASNTQISPYSIIPAGSNSNDRAQNHLAHQPPAEVSSNLQCKKGGAKAGLAPHAWPCSRIYLGFWCMWSTQPSKAGRASASRSLELCAAVRHPSLLPVNPFQGTSAAQRQFQSDAQARLYVSGRPLGERARADRGGTWHGQRGSIRQSPLWPKQQRQTRQQQQQQLQQTSLEGRFTGHLAPQTQQASNESAASGSDESYDSNTDDAHGCPRGSGLPEVCVFLSWCGR